MNRLSIISESDEHKKWFLYISLEIIFCFLGKTEDWKLFDCVFFLL